MIYFLHKNALSPLPKKCYLTLEDAVSDETGFEEVEGVEGKEIKRVKSFPIRMEI